MYQFKEYFKRQIPLVTKSAIILGKIKLCKTNEQRFEILSNNVDDPGGYYKSHGFRPFNLNIIKDIVKNSSKDLSNDYEFVLTVVLNSIDPETMKIASNEILSDKEFLLEVLEQKANYHWNDYLWLSHIPKEVFNDIDFLLTILKLKPNELWWIPEDIKNNKDTILQLIAAFETVDIGSPERYKDFISKELLNDFDIGIAIAKKRSDTIKWLSETLLDNEEIIYTATKRKIDNFYFASKRIQNRYTSPEDLMAVIDLKLDLDKTLANKTEPVKKPKRMKI